MGAIVPEWLNASGPSAYLSMRPDTFARKVRAGVIPAPSYSVGERMPRWKRSELDAMMSPSTKSDINASVEELVTSIKAAKQKGRAGRSQDASGRNGQGIRIQGVSKEAVAAP
jgi:hypothetical protein